MMFDHPWEIHPDSETPINDIETETPNADF